jgi:hypothetical protein
MFERKQVIFRYNGDAKSEEIAVDFDSADSIPEKNALISRRGKWWKVIDVHRTSTGATRELPVYRVFLQSEK